MDHKDELLLPFWSYLDQPAPPRRKANSASKEEGIGLDSLQSSYFCKTIGVLLSKYPIEVSSFERYTKIERGDDFGKF